MTKYLLSIGLALGLVAGGYLGYIQLVQATTTTINPVYCDTSATTSVSYIAIGGTKTCLFYVRDWDDLTLFIQLNASSSATTITPRFYGSHDGIDYFDIPGVTTDSAVAATIGASTTAMTYTPLASGIVRTSFKIDTRGYNVVKVITTVNTAAGSLWQMAVPSTNL